MSDLWSDTPLIANVDVVVVGGGSAGSTAAIAAAREGARTVLLDKLPFLGGNSTAVLDTFYGFYSPGESARRVVEGLPREIVRELQSIGPVVERPNTYGAGTGITYNPEHLKVVWERLARVAGVRVLLHTFVQAVKTEGTRAYEVLVATKGGLARVSAKVFVDSSGDADVVRHAGWGFEQAGTESPAQTLTTTFRIANVNLAQRSMVGRDRLHELMEQAAHDGYRLPRREGSDHITTIAHSTSTVMTRLESTLASEGGVKNPSDPDFLSRAEMDGREQALEYMRFLVDRVPGYQDAQLSALSAQIGVRETRRVYGDYRVTRDDVLSGRQFEDQIALCGAPIEDHHGGSGSGTTWQYIEGGRTVGIPYSSLIVRDADNALVAGRCFSATHDAHASIRSMAQCMAMGQAAGVAAARVAQNGLTPREIPAVEVRDRLAELGAMVDDR